MFNLGFSEIILIAIIALIFIGPKQIPEVARVLGSFIRDLKRASYEFQRQISKPSEEVNFVSKDLRQTVSAVLEAKESKQTVTPEPSRDQKQLTFVELEKEDADGA